jgi:opacity protein-like surface antigen
VARSQNFYLDADAGAAFAENVNVHRFPGLIAGGKVRLDPGGRFSVAGGYHFNDYIGVQLETGIINNEIKSIAGARGVDGSLSHVPLLADVVVRYDRPDCKLVPYAGAGLGGDTSVINLDHVRAGGFVVDGSAGETVFAWQAFAGARYKISDKMSVGAGYKFFSAEGASYDVRHALADIKLGTAQVHSAVVDFTMKF